MKNQLTYLYWQVVTQGTCSHADACIRACVCLCCALPKPMIAFTPSVELIVLPQPTTTSRATTHHAVVGPSHSSLLCSRCRRRRRSHTSRIRRSGSLISHPCPTRNAFLLSYARTQTVHYLVWPDSFYSFFFDGDSFCSWQP